LGELLVNPWTYWGLDRWGK